MKTEAQIRAKRRELEEELAALDAEEQALGELTPDQRLAESLHSLGCSWNHTDGCDWFYGSWTDTVLRHGMQTWLRKAINVRSLLPDFTDEQILKVAEALR